MRHTVYSCYTFKSYETQTNEDNVFHGVVVIVSHGITSMSWFQKACDSDCLPWEEKEERQKQIFDIAVAKILASTVPYEYVHRIWGIPIWSDVSREKCPSDSYVLCFHNILMCLLVMIFISNSSSSYVMAFRLRVTKQPRRQMEWKCWLVFFFFSFFLLFENDLYIHLTRINKKLSINDTQKQMHDLNKKLKLTIDHTQVASYARL